MTVMCLVLIAALIAVERRSPGWAAVAGGLLLLGGNMHTYDVAVLHGALVVYALVLIRLGRLSRREAVVGYAIILAISAPAPFWAWWAARQDPAYQAKVDTPTLSPPPLDFAMGYGLILLLATGPPMLSAAAPRSPDCCCRCAGRGSTHSSFTSSRSWPRACTSRCACSRRWRCTLDCAPLMRSVPAVRARLRL